MLLGHARYWQRVCCYGICCYAMLPYKAYAAMICCTRYCTAYRTTHNASSPYYILRHVLYATHYVLCQRIFRGEHSLLRPRRLLCCYAICCYAMLPYKACDATI